MGLNESQNTLRDQVPPMVSVCIANYNGVGIIEDCIKSVRVQDFEFPIEIIVHDDASSDASVELIRTHFPDVRLIESSENFGFCIANNRMAAVAEGHYLLLLNNDATLFPDALRVLCAEAERLSQPAILTLPQYDAYTGELLDIGLRLDPFLNPVPNLDPRRNDVGTVHGACLWIPRALWLELGGFPEWFGSLAEDLYLCCRARLAGHPVRALGVSGYRHRVGHSFGGGAAREGKLVTTFRRRALSERNKSFVLVICYPMPSLQIVLPVHLFFLHLEGLLLALLKQEKRLFGDIYAPLIPSLWRQRKRLLHQRRRLQADRQISLISFLAPFQWTPRKLSLLLRHGLPRLR